jgi:large subunit ribosomal protein L28
MDLCVAGLCPREETPGTTPFLVPIDFRRTPVAANCDVCGKGPGFGHNISHSHRRTKRRWNPNIQRVKALVGDAGVTPKRLNVCTSCLKAGKVKR